MIYKFKSPATGDLLMLEPQGDLMLRLMGREPSAKGIIGVADMPLVIDALQRAVAADDADRGDSAPDRETGESGETGENAGRDPVSLRRRLWPMVEMLKRAHAAGEPVVWGV